MTPLLQTRALSRAFTQGRAWWPGLRHRITALDRISLALLPGASLGVVGGSGSGKSTLARCLIGLDRPTAGELLWNGRATAGFTRAQWLACWRQAQYCFQDAPSALNPRHTLGQTLEAPLRALLRLSRARRAERVDALLDRVGLPPAFRDRYPHELSGGQAQRVVIARALAPEPRVLILDEPVSALDVSIQAQILALLSDLRRDLDLTLILISHDLAVVERLCDDLVVLRAGRVVEQGSRDRVFASPRDPYTARLITCAPVLHPGKSI